MSPTITAIALGATVLLLRSGRLVAGGLLLPAIALARWTWEGGATGPDRTAWALALAGFGVTAAVLGSPWVRARVLGGRAFRTARRIAEEDGAAAAAEPTLFERWTGAGAPRRAMVAQRREPLAERPVEAEEQLDRILAEVDAVEAAQSGDLAQATWSRLATSRLLGAGVAAEHGGLGLTPLAHSDLVARAASHAPLVAGAIGASGPGGFAELVRAFGTDEQRTSLLPRLARGEILGALAWTGIERIPGSARAVATVEKRGGRRVEGFRLSFAHDAIEAAPRAAYVAVVLDATETGAEEASADGAEPGERRLGATCFLVPTDTEGLLGFTRSYGFAASLPSGPVGCEGVFVPRDAVLGGEAGLGRGDVIARWSTERRAGWQTVAIECGIAERAARVAAQTSTVAVERKRPHARALGKAYANVVAIDALRRAVCARLGSDTERGGALFKGAGEDARDLARRTLEIAFEVAGPQSGFGTGDGALESLVDWLTGSAARHGASAAERGRLVADGHTCKVVLDQATEREAIRAGDLRAFDRLRMRRHARFAATGLRCFERAARRFVLGRLRRNAATGSADLDDLACAFAVAAEAYARTSQRMLPGVRDDVAADLSSTFRSVARALALLEGRDVEDGRALSRGIDALAHEQAIVEGWRAALGALAALPSGLAATWARVTVRTLAPTRRLAHVSGPARAGIDVHASHDVRVNLTSNVWVPDGEGLGLLERAAEAAYAAERPLARIRAAIAARQLPDLDAATFEDLETLASEALRLELISDRDQKSVVAAANCATILRRLEPGPDEERLARTSA